MEIPTFKSHWGYPRRRPRYDSSGWELPVNRSNPTSRIVNIPVRLVGPERSKSDSAVKIQKVLRGFLVRKSVKKIVAMRTEADGIEKKLKEREFVELIGTNAKERLKVSETLMNLLFKLDSVRGMDSGVRDCRKEVIKKVIALQEKVDGVVAEEKAAGVVIRTPAVDSDDAAADEMNQSQAMDHSMAEMSTENKRSAIEDPVVSANADIVNESETSEVEEIVRVNQLKSPHLMDEFADLEMSTEHEQSCLELGRADEILDAGTEAEFISTQVGEKWDKIPSTKDVAEEPENAKEAESQSDLFPKSSKPCNQKAKKQKKTTETNNLRREWKKKTKE